MALKKTYFVSGIDTDAGKTFATGILAAAWRGEGVNVITQKFIQTGHRGGLSEDITMHRRIMNMAPTAEDLDFTTCPIRFSYPASADLAARLEGREVDLTEFERALKKLQARYDCVLVEGAGGLMVPIKGSYTTLDYIAGRGFPVILVTNPRLGSVNHTLLSLEACRSRGVKVDFVLYNHFPVTSAEITDDTRQVFQNYLAAHFPRCEFIEIPFIRL